MTVLASERGAPPTTKGSNDTTACRPDTIFDAVQLNRPFTPWKHTAGHNFEATGTPPGPLKVEVLAKRLEEGLPLWHQDDPDVGANRAAEYEVEVADSDSDVEEARASLESRKQPQKVALAPRTNLAEHRECLEIENAAIQISVERVHDQQLEGLHNQEPEQVPLTAYAKEVVDEYRRLQTCVSKNLVLPTSLQSFIDENRDTLAAFGLEVTTVLAPTQEVGPEERRAQDHLVTPRDMRLIRERLVQKGQILPS